MKRINGMIIGNGKAGKITKKNKRPLLGKAPTHRLEWRNKRLIMNENFYNVLVIFDKYLGLSGFIPLSMEYLIIIG